MSRCPSPPANAGRPPPPAPVQATTRARPAPGRLARPAVGGATWGEPRPGGRGRPFFFVFWVGAEGKRGEARDGVQRERSGRTMTLHIRDRAGLPADIAAVGQQLLPATNAYRVIGD